MSCCRQFICKAVKPLTTTKHVWNSSLSVSSATTWNPYYFQPVRNAGHSKWANIKHVKAAKDQEKSAQTSRYVNMIKIAIREGGGTADPKSNTKLAQVLTQIKEAKLPLSSFEKTLQREQARKDEKRQTLLMKGPGNCILVTEISSENLMKTRQELNTILRKNRGITAEDSLLRQFHHKGVILSTDLNGKPASPEQLDDTVVDAIEAGADDVLFHPEHPEFGNVYEFHTSPESFFKVKHALEKLKYTIVSGEVEYIPMHTVDLEDSYIQEALKLYQKLTEHPNVVKVATNIA